jgi:hypothetical protein
MQKQRDFQAQLVFSKNGGWAPKVEKCEFPREKRDRYGFTPLKRPGFLLKPSQTMRIHAETTRIQSRIAHKAPTAARESSQTRCLLDAGNGSRNNDSKFSLPPTPVRR